MAACGRLLHGDGKRDQGRSKWGMQRQRRSGGCRAGSKWLGITMAVVVVGYLALIAFLVASFAYYGI